jgi:hypothetical protein
MTLHLGYISQQRSWVALFLCFNVIILWNKFYVSLRTATPSILLLKAIIGVGSFRRTRWDADTWKMQWAWEMGQICSDATLSKGNSHFPQLAFLFFYSLVSYCNLHTWEEKPFLLAVREAVGQWVSSLLLLSLLSIHLPLPVNTCTNIFSYANSPVHLSVFSLEFIFQLLTVQASQFFLS